MATTVDTLTVRKGIQLVDKAIFIITGSNGKPLRAIQQLDADTVREFIAEVDANDNIIGLRPWADHIAAKAGGRMRFVIYGADIELASGSRIKIDGQEVRPPG